MNRAVGRAKLRPALASVDTLQLQGCREVDRVLPVVWVVAIGCRLVVHELTKQPWDKKGDGKMEALRLKAAKHSGKATAAAEAAAGSAGGPKRACSTRT